MKRIKEESAEAHQQQQQLPKGGNRGNQRFPHMEVNPISLTHTAAAATNEKDQGRISRSSSAAATAPQGREQRKPAGHQQKHKSQQKQSACRNLATAAEAKVTGTTISQRLTHQKSSSPLPVHPVVGT
jgi:hypothetical protein